MFKSIERIINEAFNRKFDSKSLTEADKVQVTAPTFANKESDFNIKSMIKSKQDEVEAQRKAEAEAKRKEELKQKYADLLDKVQEALDNGEEIDDVVHILFEKLVPAEGPCDTVAGELIRSISRIGYRDYNDGDVFYEGYGIETCGPAVSYIIDNIDGMFDKFDNIAKAQCEDDEYTNAINDIAKDIVEYIINNPETLETPITKEMFDYNYDWIYRDWEPKYDLDVDVIYELDEHVEAGHIDYGDVENWIEDIIRNMPGLYGDAYVRDFDGWFEVHDLPKDGYEELKENIDTWMQDWAEELDEEYPLDDEEFDESCKSRKNKKSIKEDLSNATLADFFEMNGYADVDVYDKDWDYGTAIVWEGEKPSDNYDEFVDWVVKNTKYVRRVDDITVVADFSDLIDKHWSAFGIFTENNNRDDYQMSRYEDKDDKMEIALMTLVSMLEGNYSDNDYSDFLELIETL